MSIVLGAFSWGMLCFPKRYSDFNAFNLLGGISAIVAFGIWGASGGSVDDPGAIWGNTNSWCNRTAEMACDLEYIGGICDLTYDGYLYTSCDHAMAWGFAVYCFGASVLLINFAFINFCAPTGEIYGLQQEGQLGNLRNQTFSVS